MKKLLCVFIVIFMTISVFSQDLRSLLFGVIANEIESKRIEEASKSELLKSLEKNNKKNIEISGLVSVNGFAFNNYDNTFSIPELKSDKFTIIAEIETEFLNERINYLSSGKVEVTFVLKSIRPKTYAITTVSRIETVAEYKARLEAERLAKLEAERIAEEKRLEEERIAEEKRLEEERIAEEKRLEEERIAEEKRIAEEEKKQRNAKYLPTYEGCLAKAKKYETEKRWCYALDSYYDAMGTVGLDPEYKTEAVNGYNALKESILSGNPGFGTYSAFSLHDEWKKLLIDAEKYGCSFNPYKVSVGDLVQGDLDYTTKTASYSANIHYSVGNRYNSTIKIIEEGYYKAYKDDWDDLPEEWPKYSASYNNDDVYNVNGVYIFRAEKYDLYGKVIDYSYYNAFGINHNFTYEIYVQIPFTSRIERIFYREIDTLIDCKFNIVDENGKELVKPVRCLLGRQSKVLFSGITPEIMNLIDNGKAFINPVGCYLQYGKYNKDDDKGGRSFIKNFPEVQLPLETAEIICWNNKFDKTYDSFKKAIEYENIQKELATVDMKKLDSINFEMIKIPEKNIEFAETEITQELYVSVMGENPSEFKGANNPVECVSWYDAIYFCNKLSMLKGFTPVYAVDDNIAFTEWNYTPHKGDSIEGEITQNLSANGYRLPTVEEWEYAAKGGQDYTYAGSNEIDEVAWHSGNRNDKTHPVAQKRANGYGLYDMSGNVSEWCWDSSDSERYCCGGSWWDSYGSCKVSSGYNKYAGSQDSRNGFRIVRSYK